MKRNALVFGLISGLILAVIMVISISVCYGSGNFDGSMVIGYASMILAFSLIFVGIKNYRDKYNGGFITFGKAFKVGAAIAFVASTVYVLVWLVDYYVFVPDFMDRYVEYLVRQAKSEGLTAAQLQTRMKDMENMREMYRNPFFVVLITYLEVLPLGLIISVLASLILRKRKSEKDEIERFANLRIWECGNVLIPASVCNLPRSAKVRVE